MAAENADDLCNICGLPNRLRETRIKYLEDWRPHKEECKCCFNSFDGSGTCTFVDCCGGGTSPPQREEDDNEESSDGGDSEESDDESLPPLVHRRRFDSDGDTIDEDDFFFPATTATTSTIATPKAKRKEGKNMKN